MALRNWKNLERALKKIYELKDSGSEDRGGVDPLERIWEVSPSLCETRRDSLDEIIQTINSDHQQGISPISAIDLGADYAIQNHENRYRIRSRADWNPIRQELGHWPLERISDLIDSLWDADSPALAMETMRILHLLRLHREQEDYGGPLCEPKNPFAYDESYNSNFGYDWDVTAITNILAGDGKELSDCASEKLMLPFAIIRKAGRWYVEACEFESHSDGPESLHSINRHFLIPVEKFNDYQNGSFPPGKLPLDAIEDYDNEEIIELQATTPTNFLGHRLHEGELFKFTATVDEILARQILAQGSKIRVINPPTLRKKILSIISKH